MNLFNSKQIINIINGFPSRIIINKMVHTCQNKPIDYYTEMSLRHAYGKDWRSICEILYVEDKEDKSKAQTNEQEHDEYYDIMSSKCAFKN